jgi:YbbR domain-containing protein
MARRGTRNVRMGLLALVIAVILWGIAHGSSSVEQGLDIPVSFHGLPNDLVVTGQSTDQVNIRVRGSRSALRNLSPAKLDYVVDVAGAKPGLAAYEIDVSRFDLPRGANVVSRSPATLEVEFERRGRRAVRIRADIEGEPSPGFLMGEVVVDPPRVWLTGARSEVMRLTEVVTETIDVAGAQTSIDREARLSLGGGHVWMEETRLVRVKIPIEPVEGAKVEADEKAGGKRG